LSQEDCNAVKHWLLLALAVGLLASSSKAQVTTDSAATRRQPTATETVIDSVGTDATQLVSLSQVVSFRDGRPVARAPIIANSVGAKPPLKTRTTTTNSRGLFQFDSLIKGTYDVQVIYPGGSITRRIVVDGPVLGAIVVPAVSLQGSASLSRIIWTIAPLAFFLISLVFTRWHNIAKSLHALLLQQLTTLSIRLKTEVGGSNPPEVAALQETVVRLQEQMQESWKKFKIFEFVF
jgi:hypothetical protein